MRIYKLPNWKYAVETTKHLALKKRYAEQFRYDYFVLLGTKKGFKSRFGSLSFGCIVYLNHLRHILIRQLIKGKPYSLDCKYNFYIANNPSYIRTISPIAENLIKNGEDVAVFCPANHYKQLKKKLSPQLTGVLYVMEDARIVGSRIAAFAKIFIAVLGSIRDGLWFLMQPVSGRFFFAIDFMKYALSNYCYSNHWEQYFNAKNRYLIAANEFQYWEAFLFVSCRNTVTESIILAHGRETEISYPLFASKRFTWGKNEVDLLVNEYGASVSEVVALGSPYFDRIYNEIRSNEIKRSGFNNEFITFYGQPNYKSRSEGIKEYGEVLNWFYNLAQSFPSKKFMVKLHPYDNAEYYKTAPANVIVSSESIIQSMEKCFIMLTVDSNSILEAAVFGIPAIQCIVSGSEISFDYSSSEISIRVTSEDELTLSCNKLTENEQFYAETINKSELALQGYFANLGHSLEAILSEIK